MLATFIALGGTAYASGVLPVLPPNSVGTRQIKSGAVTLGKISLGAQTTLHQPVGRAGGALAGSYPNPRLNLASPQFAAYSYTQFGPSAFEGWEDYGCRSRYCPVQTPIGATFYRDNEDVVHLAGVVKSFFVTDAPNSNPNLCGVLPIFTLPVGYRPSALQIFAVESNGAGRVDVSPDGTVACVVGTGDQYVSLDGIAFRAAR